MSEFLRRRSLIMIMLWLPVAVMANRLEFTLHKHSEQAGPTLLVIGGIQGDEPGGFTAASLLVTDYRIAHGNLWVVPNLNFESIIKRSRGVHGDMNRKFSALKKADPEYDLVQKIKTIILDQQVDLILNLHDGSGFYAPQYFNHSRNPQRWGQSIIIDQAKVSTPRYGRLQNIADNIALQVNKHIEQDKYQYHVKNTHTSDGNKEMEKTLTYFAIRHGKSAFGVEASKSFRTHQRAYYHLLVAEAFMQAMGIKYERSFPLQITKLKHKIDNNVRLALYEKKIYFDMSDVRRRINYVPLQKDSPLRFTASNPLIAILDKNNTYNVRYGNRHVTNLHPQFFEYDDSLQELEIFANNQRNRVSMGDILPVKNSFTVNAPAQYRVNIIGYSKPGLGNENAVHVQRKEISERFSIDESGSLFRVEIYRDEKFCGMVLIKFVASPVAENQRQVQPMLSDS